MEPVPERPLAGKAVEDLYKQCRSRPPEPGREHDPAGLPVIVLLGRRGGGKTTLARWLGHVGGLRPNAFYDFEASPPRRPYDIAARLAYKLSHRFPRQPRLLFPRLTLGLVVVDPALSLPPTDHQAAIRQLRRALQPPREPSPAAERFIDVVGLLQELNVIQVPGMGLVSGLLRRPPRLPLGVAKHAAFTWYEGPHSALDELVALNQLSTSDTEEDRAAVDRRLCAAFLADLRAEYGGNRRDRACTVLLDNVDHQGGREFLDLLLNLRETADPDPLLVVATATRAREMPGPYANGPTGRRVHAPEQATYRDWLAGIPRPDDGQPWRCYHIQLRDFTRVEAARVDQSAGAPVGITDLAYELSCGHPWSTQLLRGAAARAESEGGPRDTAALILSRPHTAPRAPAAVPLRKFALDYLLKGLTADQRAALTVGAAARHLEEADNAGLLDGFQTQTRNTLIAEMGSRMWLVPAVPEDCGNHGGRSDGYLGPASAAPLVLHPWLRLLLLEELADDPALWADSHRRLRTWYEGQNRRVEALYHALALGAGDEVVTGLDARLEAATDTESWLRDLYAVTAAPQRRPVDADRSAVERVDILAEEFAPHAFASRRSLAILVTALWLAKDPRNRLPTPSGSLNPTIAAMFQDLALHSSPRRAGLRQEAGRYT